MSEFEIQVNLFSHLIDKGYRWICPNITLGYVCGEMDLCSVTKAKLLYEYEIKCSKSDFRADFKKRKHLLYEQNAGHAVHELRYTMPNYFNFVTPKDLIKVEDVPDYAGLIYYDASVNPNVKRFVGSSFIQVKKPVQLHKQTVTDKILLTIGDKLMWRNQVARQNLLIRNNEIEKMRANAATVS